MEIPTHQYFGDHPRQLPEGYFTSPLRADRSQAAVFVMECLRGGDPIVAVDFAQFSFEQIWVWINTYRYIFSGMNIHLPAILGFTRYQGFDPSPSEIVRILRHHPSS